MHQLKKTALVVALAGCTTGVAYLGSQIDRSPHATCDVAKGLDLTRLANMDAPVLACYSPDTPVPARFDAAIQSMFLEAMLRYNLSASWTGTGQGTTLSWSFVPDGLTIPSGIGEPSAPSTTFATMDGQFASRAEWIGRFEQSFQRWADLTDLDYIRVTDGANDWDDGSFWGTSGNDTTRGDVRIAFKPIDGGSGVLAYNSFPTNSDMVMDSGEFWNGSNNDRFLRNVIMHEHGHGLGYSHVCSSNAGFLMEPFIQTSFDGPQEDDIRGSQRGYGDPNEPDNSTGQATDLGTLVNGSSVSLGDLPNQPVGGPQPSFSSSLSIDANSEVDFFEFNVGTPVIIDVTVDPVGRTYDDSNQNANGSCASGNNIDSEEIADLAFDIRDSGNNVIGTFDSQPLGIAENASGFLLPAAGTYYVRVYETNSPGGSQLYIASIDVTGAAECTVNGECDDGDPCTTDICDNGQCLNTAGIDCNGNGRDDVCEIAQGDAEDCNMNGIPDDCDVSNDPFSGSSPQLGPIGDGSPQSYTFLNTSEASTDVTMDFEALGDFSSSLENLEVFVGGVSAGLILDVSGTPDCNMMTDQIVLPMSDWNNARNGAGDVTVDFVSSASVSSTACLPGQNNYVQVDVNYESDASAADVNMNGIPDECEMGGCAFADITTTATCDVSMPDGVIDLSDFSCYLSEWSAQTAFSDITLTGTCDVVAGGGDGTDLSDFSCYLNEWSAGCP